MNTEGLGQWTTSVFIGTGGDIKNQCPNTVVPHQSGRSEAYRSAYNAVVKRTNDKALLWVFGIAWLLLSVALVLVSFESGRPWLSFLALLIPLLPIAIVGFLYLLPLLIHELGHALGGWAFGLQLSGLGIGPIAWNRSGDRFRLSFDKSQKDGLTVMTPKSGTQWTYTSLMAFVCGGPIASLVATLGSVVILVERHGFKGQGDFFGFIVALFGVLNLLTALGGFWGKHSVPGTISDGAVFKSRKWRETHLLSPLILHNSAHLRPSEWDEWALARQSELQDSPANILLGNRMAYCHYFDLGDLDRAKQHLDLALAVEQPNLPESIAWAEQDTILEGAYFYAGFRYDAGKSAQLIARASQLPVRDKGTARRALIASALASGRLGVSTTRINRALSKLDSKKIADVVERDWLRRLANEYKIPVGSILAEHDVS